MVTRSGGVEAAFSNGHPQNRHAHGFEGRQKQKPRGQGEQATGARREGCRDKAGGLQGQGGPPQKLHSDSAQSSDPSSDQSRAEAT